MSPRIEARLSVMLKAIRRLLERDDRIRAMALLEETILQAEAYERAEDASRDEKHEIRDATWGIYG